MIRAGIQDWWFCTLRNCDDPETRVPSLGGTLWTRVWFERWNRDWQKSRMLRQILETTDRGRPIHNYTEDEVARQVALLIERGVLHIHASTAWVHTEETTSEGGVFAPPPQPAFPLADRRPQASSPPPSPAQTDQPTFAAQLQVNAQVAALLAAAHQGAPFCPE